MIWTWYKDDWLVTRQAARLFLVSTFLVLALTPVFLANRYQHNVVLGAASMGHFGNPRSNRTVFSVVRMWRYWVRIDRSDRWAKRMWFVVLLLGFWWGSCLYCFFAYLPQVSRRAKVEV